MKITKYDKRKRIFMDLPGPDTWYMNRIIDELFFQINYKVEPHQELCLVNYKDQKRNSRYIISHCTQFSITSFGKEITLRFGSTINIESHSRASFRIVGEVNN